MDRRFTPVHTQPNLLAGSPKQNTVTTKISGEYDWIGQASAPQELLTRRDSEQGKVVSKRMVDLAAEAKRRTWRQKEKRNGEQSAAELNLDGENKNADSSNT
jgi:hypothetical protein